MSGLDQHIEHLRTLSTAQLRQEWQRVWKEPAPRLGHDQHYAGEHPPIVNREVFELAQRQHAENKVVRKQGRNIDDPSLLTGLLFDSAGRRMTPNHACKGSRRYRYYVSRPDPTISNEPLMRVPAGEVERKVISHIAAVLAEPDLLHRLIERCGS